MKLPELSEVTTKEQARQIAIDWQHEQRNRAMSWQDVLDQGAYFEKLAERFDLTEEFKENGII